MGLKIADNVLYVVEGLDANDKVHGYELTNGKEVFLVSIKEATELNDLEADNKGLLYVSDRSGSKVFVINTFDSTYKLLIDGTVKSPNGICLDRSKKSLLICNGFNENCNIFSYHLESGKLDTLVKTNYLHLDGLVSDRKGRIYFSASSKDWKTSKLVKYDNGKFEELLENKSGITDIAFNPYRKGIDMAFYYANEIGFYKL
jgi:sugar lactone lactonase YvrE